MRVASLHSTFNPHPLALLALCFANGILTARFINLPLAICLACGAGFSIIAVLCFFRRKHTYASVFICLAFFCAGAGLAAIEKRSVRADRVQRLYDEGVIASGDPVELTGVLERQPEPAPDGFYLTLRVEKLRFKETERDASGEVWLYAPVSAASVGAEYEALELRYGARVRVMCALRRAESFRNPGVSSFTEYLERRGADATATIKSPLLVERLDDERVFLPLAWLYLWRQQLLGEMDRLFNYETAGVLKATLLGNRHQLSRRAAERFREGGTFHIIVISGLHISFIGGVMLFIARRLTRRRAWQFAASVTALWAYTLAVGAEATVVRAALMFTVVALAPVLHRRAHSLNALGAAALGLLVWRPSELFDPSFQLTFLSVLLIVAVAWPLIQRARDVGAWHPTRVSPYPPRCPRWWRMLGETLFWSEKSWQRELKRSVWSCRLFKTPLAARLERLHLQRPLRYCFNALVVSACVQVGLLPLLVVYFHRFSLSSFILNIFVGVLMAAFSIVALSAILLAQLSAQLAAPLARLAEIANFLMAHSVDPFSSAGIAALRLPEYTGWPALIYVLYFVPLTVLAFALARWNPLRLIEKDSAGESLVPHLVSKVAALALFAALILIVFHPASGAKSDGRLRVDFLDVGQGDALLLTMPDGTTLLVDGGGRAGGQARDARVEGVNATESFEADRRSVGEAVVSEYLWWRGLDQVDYILATHADADHIDGLNDVMRNFKVHASLVARAPANDPEYAIFAATAREKSVPVILVGRGDVLRFGEVEAQVLWPERSNRPGAPSTNDDSMVLRVRFGERVFLLTGDVERQAETTLSRAPDALRCDVLKVAHHGSKTSSIESFVAATSPKLAVISVGQYSIFGHPHQDVLKRWRANGAEILTTGRSGTITVSTDGRDLRVETFVKK
jgi:competence protein ComEC